MVSRRPRSLGKLKQSGVSWSPIQETFEQGLVSGVMRCLLCGLFPLFCVVHALCSLLILPLALQRTVLCFTHPHPPFIHLWLLDL